MLTDSLTPRAHQLAYMRRAQRWAVLVWHRRAGKTVAALLDLLVRALGSGVRSDSRYAYVAPTFAQAKDVAWALLHDLLAGVPGSVCNETELRATLPNGASLRLYGAENPDRMRGLYLDGVVLDEPAQQPERLWSEVLRPALADRRGWATWIGTPQGQDAFAALYERAEADSDWYASRLRWDETGALPNDEIEAARRAMSASQFRQEFECDFAAPVDGAYWAEELDQAQRDGRISRGVWEPGVPCVTAWDLGIGDSTCILVGQVVGRERRVVEGYSASGQGLAHYVEWLRSRPYTYRTHYLPHDAGHRQLGDASGRTLAEIVEALGVRPVEVLGRADVDPGIEAVRQLLQTAWIDSEGCKDALQAWRAYRKEWDDRGRVWRPRPRHDWSSHYSDALRYLAVAMEPEATAHATPYRLPQGVGSWMS